LRRPAIDKQLDPSHKTGIVRRKKKCRRGDLMRLTDPTHRGVGGSMLLLRMRGAASDDDMNLSSARAASRCFDTASTPTAK